MVYQLIDGSGIERSPVMGVTARTVPLGSKYSWLMVLQLGQGTRTEATDRPAPANPLPAHFTVTLTDSWHPQQAKSRITFSSIMEDGPLEKSRK
jgi:hypothetical protein